MNKGVISLIEAKFFLLIDLIYQLTKTSFFFWVILIKNFIFPGLIVSFCTLFEVIEEVLSGNGLPIRKLFKEISPKYKGNKRLSLCTSGLMIYLSAFIILPFPPSMSSSTASIIKFAIIYLFLLIMVLFTYISWILMKKDLPVKKMIMYAFYLMMKRFMRTIMIVLIVVALFYLGHMNLTFFFFLSPALYVFCVRLVFKNVTL